MCSLTIISSASVTLHPKLFSLREKFEGVNPSLHVSPPQAENYNSTMNSERAKLSEDRSMSCDSDEWENSECLNFKELEDQIAQIVDNGNMEEMLNTQLSEVEMLQSMFSNPGEFCIDDHSVIADINEFVDGKSTLFPPRLDFAINLVIDGKMKLEVCVNLPHDYPASEPDIFVRSNELGRNQQHSLNNDLAKFISTLDRGEICICSAVSWLQEQASRYHEAIETKPKTVINCNADDKVEWFARFWIYSHHIYSKTKRKEMLELAKEYSITGFCLPGRPGIICAEGSSWDCEQWWQKVKFMNWKKIMCKKRETVQLESTELASHRKFSTFAEISFEAGKGKSRDCHMDMGELYQYLAQHDCSYVFKDYFGVDGKSAALQHSTGN